MAVYLRAGLWNSVGESASINSLDSDDFILFPVLHDYAEVEISFLCSCSERKKTVLASANFVWLIFFLGRPML